MHGKVYKIDKLISELGNIEKQLEELSNKFDSHHNILRIIFLLAIILGVIVAICCFIYFLESRIDLRKQKIQIIERQLNLVGSNGKNYDVLVSTLSEI